MGTSLLLALMLHAPPPGAPEDSQARASRLSVLHCFTVRVLIGGYGLFRIVHLCRRSTPIRAEPLIGGDSDQLQAPRTKMRERNSVAHLVTTSDADAAAERRAAQLAGDSSIRRQASRFELRIE